MIDRLHNEKIPSAAPRASNSEVLAKEIIERLTYRIGKDPKVAKPHDWLTAAILVVRDRITDNWMESTRKTYSSNAKRVYYLSLEFLIGRLMRDAVTNIGLMDELREALASFGVDLDVVGDAGAGRGTRQWRPRPSRRLFHGVDGDGRYPGLWLRHPLCPRPLPPADGRWLAGGTAGNLACPRQSLGIRAPRKLLRNRLRRLGRDCQCR